MHEPGGIRAHICTPWKTSGLAAGAAGWGGASAHTFALRPVGVLAGIGAGAGIEGVGDCVCNE